VGQAIRGIVDGLPSEQRVAIIASGHMANSVGGPGMLRIRTDPTPEFDRTMKALLAEGDAEAVIREASWERLLAAGNGTAGFLDFVLLLGAARGARPSYVDLNSTRMTTASFFLTWDAVEDGAR
jgi:protocatechuate 4,5-dioxygenase beta chain